MKYHKQIYFPLKDIARLSILNNFFKHKKFYWTYHAQQRIKERADIQYFFKWFTALNFIVENIIEYTVENNDIQKVLYRFNYNQYEDVMLSIGKTGNIITIWFNNNKDNHITLNKQEYAIK